MRMHEYFKPEQPSFSVRTASGSQMDYDFTRPAKRTSNFINDLKSSVPVLSDHYKNSSTHSAASIPVNKSYNRIAENSNKAKSDYALTNIFYQSTYQRMLQKDRNVNTDKAPFSHFSFNKEAKMLPNQVRDSSFKAYPAVNEGRSKMFYSSQIF